MNGRAVLLFAALVPLFACASNGPKPSPAFVEQAPTRIALVSRHALPGRLEKYVGKGLHAALEARGFELVEARDAGRDAEFSYKIVDLERGRPFPYGTRRTCFTLEAELKSAREGQVLWSATAMGLAMEESEPASGDLLSALFAETTVNLATDALFDADEEDLDREAARDSVQSIMITMPRALHGGTLARGANEIPADR